MDSPAVDANDPLVQSVHVDTPVLPPTPLTPLPLLVLLLLLLYVPGAHKRHEDEFIGNALKVPAGQAMHADEAWVGAYVPLEHPVHEPGAPVIRDVTPALD